MKKTLLALALGALMAMGTQAQTAVTITEPVTHQTVEQQKQAAVVHSVQSSLKVVVYRDNIDIGVVGY